MILRTTLSAVLALVSFAACAGGGSSPRSAGPKPLGERSEPASARSAFHEIGDTFLREYLRLQPVSATAIGEHAYDGAWPDLSETGEARMRAFLDATGRALAAVDRSTLDAEERVDAAILDDQLTRMRFELDELREPTWNPLVYTGLIGDGLDPLVTREFAPAAVRLASLRARLEGVPAIVSIAEARLTATSRVHLETAITQAAGLVALCERDLTEAIVKGPPELRAPLEEAARKAALALRGFQAFLERDLSNRATRSFRLGRERFARKLALTLEDAVEPDALAAEARSLLDATRAEMLTTAKELWPTLHPGKPLPPLASPADERALVRSALDALAEDRPDSATIVAEAARGLDEATAFVRARDLVRVPEEPCRVIEMPEYRRGVAIAYCDSSGPLEAKQETFYAIAPTPKDWPEERVRSFYREYNRSMLVDLTVHEAMPGHFLQAMHANRFRSPIRAVFGSGSFVEGWAVYAEWLMARHGFGGPKVRLSRQKMVLRLAANALLDHGVHAGTMEEPEALALLTGEAFQEQGEAVGKWKRARLTSAQLTMYFHGFSAMMRLRQRAEAQPGFSERGYHDALLSHGAPAMRHLPALLGW